MSGAESKSETRDNTRHLTVRLHLFIATRRCDHTETSHARAAGDANATVLRRFFIAIHSQVLARRPISIKIE